MAEGVETWEELRAVLEIGVDEIQGYFYSKPVPLPEFLLFCCRHAARDTAMKAVALG